MFWAKTNAINRLLEIDWKYSMFASEGQQLDGTLQHAIERVIGECALSSSYKQGIFLNAVDRFKLNELTINAPFDTDS
jgi:lipopolysaccharide biosynthesis protein